MEALVITPWHYETESLLGYVLRVSERNRYDSPWHVMNLAKIPPGKMQSAGFPVERFAAILGRNSNELDHLSYSKQENTKEREFWILGQSLGGTLSPFSLQLGKSKFCPQCVQEKGFIDAFFDLGVAIACPDHKKSLVDTCTECGNGINLFRPGVLMCKCGAGFASVPTKDVSQELAELMSIIKAKVHGVSLHTIDSRCGFPMEHLESVPLRYLLMMVGKLGQMSLLSQGRAEKELEGVTQAASEALMDWPNGYRSILRRLGKPNVPTHGLTKFFEKMCYSIFSRHTRLEGCEFLRKEIVRYAIDEWGDVAVNRYLTRGEEAEKRFVSSAEQASRCGVNRRTLKKLGEKGIIPMKVITSGKSKRYIVDTKLIQNEVKPAGRTLGERAAAAYMGLPLSVLRSLRKTGHYTSKYLFLPRATFHENDLKDFQERLLALCEIQSDLRVDCISLGDVMRLKFRYPEGKADFIRLVLSRQMEVVGRVGCDINGLMFENKSVMNILRDKRAEVVNGTWSLAEAAKYIHCDPLIIPSLISEGLLDESSICFAKRVTIESVKRFHETYIAIARLAKNSGTSSRRLQQVLCDKKVPIRLFNRGYGKAGQPFVIRSEFYQLPYAA